MAKTTLKQLTSTYNALTWAMNDVKACHRREDTQRAHALQCVSKYAKQLRQELTAGVRKSPSADRMVDCCESLTDLAADLVLHHTSTTDHPAWDAPALTPRRSRVETVKFFTPGLRYNASS